MPAGHIILQNDQRMRRISQVVEQNFNAGISKRFSDEADQTHVVLEILVRIVNNFPSVVFFEQLCVDFLFGRFELRPHVVLLTNENKLPCCRVIVVLQEIMHSEPEIFETKLAKVLAANRERIEIVFLDVPAEFPAAFLVFSPNKTRGQKKERGDDGSDDVDAKLALQGFNHLALIIARSTI